MAVSKRHNATVGYLSITVMYAWENTMNIVNIYTFVHAINNLVTRQEIDNY